MRRIATAELFPVAALRPWAEAYIAASVVGQRERIVEIIRRVARRDRGYRMAIKHNAPRGDGARMTHEAATALRALEVVRNRHEPPWYPQCFDETIEFLRLLSGPKSKQRSGRKPTPHYLEAVAALQAEGVEIGDAKMLLRAAGLPLPGPKPQS